MDSLRCRIGATLFVCMVSLLASLAAPRSKKSATENTMRSRPHRLCTPSTPFAMVWVSMKQLAPGLSKCCWSKLVGAVCAWRIHRH